MSASDLLPPNATPFERAQSATDGARVLAAPTDLVRSERQPETCSAPFVAPLAWERSVHHWIAGDDTGNRARIASSFVDHGGYGAPATLEAEISLDTGETCILREFHEFPGGVWPDFQVDVVYEPGAPLPATAPVRTSALKRKNVRDLLVGVRLFGDQPAAAVSVGAATFATSIVTVLPAEAAISPAMTVGAAARAISYVTVLPLRRS